MYVEYDSNNSGGSWWLEDKDWKALEAAGWKVRWAWLDYVYEDNDYERDEDGTPKLSIDTSDNALSVKEGERWLGTLARGAYRVGLPIRDAVDEWQKITGADPYDAGCSCCGQPHNFSEYDDNGKYVVGGPEPTGKCEW